MSLNRKPVQFFTYTVADLEKRLQVVREIDAPDLDARLQIIMENDTPKETDEHHYWYDLRNGFLKANPDFQSVTHGSETATFYVDWSQKIINFCTQHCEEFGIPKNRWWLLRDMLNIHPEGRAECQSENGDFMVDWKSRDRVAKDCSFIIVCEKKTVSDELCKALRDKEYKLSLISSGGKTVADVLEAVTQSVESLETENFFILFLHDFDLEGVQMLTTLLELCPKTIDIGVSPQFLKFLGQVDPRLVEEQCLNKKIQKELECKICGLLSTCGVKPKELHSRRTYCPIRSSKYLDLPENSATYTLKDFEYLQGHETEYTEKGKTKKGWQGKRIEIDAVHVEYGIKPFVDYIESRLADIDCWDLTRIGIEEQEIHEPRNEYETRIFDKECKVRVAYDNKVTELSKNHDEILTLIKHTMTLPPEYSELRNKFLNTDSATGHAVLKTIEPLKEKYSEQIAREWKDDYQDGIDELNGKLECWDGPVNTAKEKIESKAEGIQKELNDDKADDPDLEEFGEELGRVEWGRDELEAINAPDRVEEINRAIEALAHLRDRLPSEADGTGSQK